MSDWQERITQETAPAIRAEHELRYRVATPLIRGAGAWADLGCGNGLAAAAALGTERPERGVLVDIDAQAIAIAARELGLSQSRQLVADLTRPEELRLVSEALLPLGEGPVLTCFEVLEHLRSFLALLEWSNELAREHAATFILSVPNDAFWSTRNPHHLTVWSEAAFDELRQLLPSEHTLLRQVALSGSTMVAWQGGHVRHELAVTVGGEDAVATHFIVAFGPRHGELASAALAVQTDVSEQRRWERQRESDVAVAQHDIAIAQREAQELRAALEAQDLTIASQREELRRQTAEFDAWRTYIHELERELGRPPSGGTGEQEQAATVRETATSAPGEDRPPGEPGADAAPGAQ
jgi:hypothetical protein